MAAPFKRICQRAACQTTRRIDASPCRPFSSTPRARDQEDPFTSEAHYETDDLSSLAHSELAVHRELRALLRTAAWEMPLLASLAKPFTPVSRSEQPLRWRYTTYMGESHPAAQKVVVDFNLKDLPLDTAQQEKFAKLAGARWNPKTNVVKMSCENYETQAQNKRYLADTIHALIAESKDPNADSFQDVPVDTRHYKPRSVPKFPDEWRMTPERQAELEGKRRQALLEESARVEEGGIVSGAAMIEYARQAALEQAKKKALEQPVMAEVRRGPVGKGRGGRR